MFNKKAYESKNENNRRASSIVKCNTENKRLRKMERDVKIAFGDKRKDENAIEFL